MLLLGAALAALAAELAVVFELRRKGVKELLSREISELVVSLGPFLAFSIFASYYAPPGTIGNAQRNLAEAKEALDHLYKRLVSASFGVAALSIILSFYLARGSYGLAETLGTYAVDLDRLLGPLSSTASLVGIAAALVRHLLLLVELGGRLRPYFEALLPTLLIHRVRRFTAPLVALLFALSVITPYALSLRIPQVEAPPNLLEAPEEWGFIHFRVYDRSGNIVHVPVLIALKDSSGRLYVARASHEYTVALPAGNYTALWAAVYFTKFEVPGCCLDPKPYAYCNCPVWPVRLHLGSYSTVDVLVNLPVNLVLCKEGVGGVFIAQRGGGILPASSLECGAAVYVEPRENEPAFIAVKGGGYGVIFPSGRVPAGNSTCWYLNVSKLVGKPPGTDIEYHLLERAREGYIFWWSSVRDAVAEHLRPLFELLNSNTPSYVEYELMLIFYKGACTGQPLQIPFAEVVLRGVCCWNDSHAVPLNPFWEHARLIADSLPPIVGDSIRLFSLLFNSALLIVHWAGGLLISAGLFAEMLPYVARALAGELERGARLVPLLSLKTRRAQQQLWAPKRSIRDEIEDVLLWERSTIKRLARMLYILARGTASVLKSQPMPLVLRSIEAASASAVRRAPREMDAPRSRAALARALGRVSRALYSASVWPSTVHRLQAARFTFDKFRTLVRLARVVIPETYYRARGYKVLLPYSLEYKQLERNSLAPREVMTRYEREIVPIVRAQLREIAREIAKRAPWVTTRAEWGKLERALQEASRLYELDEAVELLLGMGKEVRKLVAKMTGVAPSPWMRLDLALYLRLRALEELGRRGESWVEFYRKMFLWEPLLPPDWRLRLHHSLWKFKWGIRWRLGETI